ncbi:hypothetical protein EVAR_57064_1 [Eumeta japonica]|uniref:Uncharacterized protein n=1 Tax=Eumeta variegata TaxID=151549 RepID=A0A4C1YA37_EUMVA|nr:hypothetical protein EVAR_57064_1 [Eumeta japonica]
MQVVRRFLGLTSPFYYYHKKAAFWYRVTLIKKENCTSGLKRDVKVTHAFTQQPVFPPSVWQPLVNAVEGRPYEFHHGENHGHEQILHTIALQYSQELLSSQSILKTSNAVL